MWTDRNGSMVNFSGMSASELFQLYKRTLENMPIISSNQIASVVCSVTYVLPIAFARGGKLTVHSKNIKAILQ